MKRPESKKVVVVMNDGSAIAGEFVEYLGEGQAMVILNNIMNRDRSEVVSINQIHHTNVIRIKYLDFEIINSGNSDGWVPTANTQPYGYHHGGNHGTIVGAMFSCLLDYMAYRPKKFSAHFKSAVTGDFGRYNDFGLLEGQIRHEGLSLPPEIKTSEDGNRSITFMGKCLSDWTWDDLNNETLLPNAVDL